MCALTRAGGAVQAAVQAGGEEEEGSGPAAGLHRRPDGEILRPPQQVAGARPPRRARRRDAPEIPARPCRRGR